MPIVRQVIPNVYAFVEVTDEQGNVYLALTHGDLRGFVMGEEFKEFLNKVEKSKVVLPLLEKAPPMGKAGKEHQRG